MSVCSTVACANPPAAFAQDNIGAGLPQAVVTGFSARRHILERLPSVMSSYRYPSSVNRIEVADRHRLPSPSPTPAPIHFSAVSES
jgi:hypothetical protein